METSCCRYNKKLVLALMQIITSEVPIASFIGSFPAITSAGTIIKPPPTPTILDKQPTQIP